MNLAQIRERTNDRLNQAVGQFYPDEYLDRVINEAHRDISNEIDAVARHPRFHGSVDISVTSAAREYVIEANASAIIDVVRVGDGGREQTVEIRAYSMRDSGRPGWGNDCYVHERALRLWPWVVGLIAREPNTQTLRVYFRGLIEEMDSDGSAPGHVPVDHHDLIPVRAAIIVLEDENRDIGNLAGIYAEKMGRMRRNLSGAVKGHASKPW